jgi:organic hydroperoxide reductase OsmC/OhrA
MARTHHYAATVTWTGNTGQGTASYRTYSRDHVIALPGKAPIAGSSDPAFRGDPSRANPEELLVSSLSACHMLWFLHLAAEAKLVVESYEDEALGEMAEDGDGGGHFTRVVLRPRVRLSSGDAATLAGVHERAHGLCFVARSVNFPVTCEPREPGEGA